MCIITVDWLTGVLLGGAQTEGEANSIADFLRSTPAQVVIWVAVLAAISVIGIYFALWFRDLARQDKNSSSDLLTDFRDLHDRGGLSQTEFKQIKSVLGEKLQEELGSKDAEKSD